MSSSNHNPHEDNKDQDVGFLNKVKNFVQDIGDKIEENIGFGKPTADVKAIHIPHIDHKTIELIVDVAVQNPNPIPIPLCDVNYIVESEGRKLISGLIPDAGTLRPHESETIEVPLKLVYDDIKNTCRDIREGSIIPYKVLVELIVDLPVLGRLTLPIEKQGEIPVPYKPEVDLTKVAFKDFSFEETNAIMHLNLINKNDFDMGLNALTYQVWLGEVEIGGAKLEKSAVIEKNGEGVVEIPISFRPKDFGSALWDIIRGKGAGYSVKGSIEVSSPFGPMKLPFSKEGGNTKLKKADDRDDE